MAGRQVLTPVRENIEVGSGLRSLSNSNNSKKKYFMVMMYPTRMPTWLRRATVGDMQKLHSYLSSTFFPINVFPYGQNLQKFLDAYPRPEPHQNEKLPKEQLQTLNLVLAELFYQLRSVILADCTFSLNFYW